MRITLKSLSLFAALLVLTSCASTAPKPKNNQTVEKMQTEIDHAVASNIKKPDHVNVSAALLPPLKIDLPASSKKQLEPRFDLVINNAPANQVLMGIVNGTRYSMLVHKDVDSNISLNLKDVTVFEALDAIRELYGYEYKVDGTRIFIEPQSIQTRVFQVNYIVGTRQGSSDTRVTSGSMAGGGQNDPTTSNANGTGAVSNNGGAQQAAQMVSASITTKSENDFWKDLGASLNGLVGSNDGKKVVINTQSGLIMVRAMPDEIRNVESFLRLMQINIERQVILEAKILNVELNHNSQNGVNWSIFGSSNSSRGTIGTVNNDTTLSTTAGTVSSGTLSGVPGTNIINTATTALGGPVFALSLQGANFAALLNFLDSQGDVHVLSSPRIATINNQKAVLKVGTDEFFVTNVQQSTLSAVGQTSQATAPTVTLQPFFSGIALDVTPQIDKDDNIILHIHPSISNVTTVTKDINLGGNNGQLSLPLASNSVSETDSIVRTRDGNVIAIGGLMTESTASNNARVPGLSKIKGIGKLFTQEGKLTTKTELVILLKATVVQGEESWNHDLLNSRERLEKLSRH